MDVSQLGLIKAYTTDPAGSWKLLSHEYAAKTSQDQEALLIYILNITLDIGASLADA